MKAQWVRLADVLFIGPYMIVMGDREGSVRGDILSMLGLLTIIYNAQNFVLEMRKGRTPVRESGPVALLPPPADQISSPAA
jgi:hypothetical protein